MRRLDDPRLEQVGHQAALVLVLIAGLAWAFTVGREHYSIGEAWEASTGLDGSASDREGAAMAVSRELLRGGAVTPQAVRRTGPLAALLGAARPLAEHDSSRLAVLVAAMTAALFAAGFAIRLTFSIGAAILALVLVFAAAFLTEAAPLLAAPLGALLVSALALALPAGGHLSLPRAVIAGVLQGAALFQAPEFGWAVAAATALTVLLTWHGHSIVAALSSIAVVVLAGTMASGRAGSDATHWLAVGATIAAVAIVARATGRSPARFLPGNHWAWCCGVSVVTLGAAIGMGLALGMPIAELVVQDLRAVTLPRFDDWREVAPGVAASALLALIAALIAVLGPWNRQSKYVAVRTRRRETGSGAGAPAGSFDSAAVRVQFGLRALLLFVGSLWVAWRLVSGRDLPLAVLPWSWLLLATEQLPDRPPSLRTLRVWLILALAMSFVPVATTAGANAPRAAIVTLAAMVATIGLHDSWQRLRGLINDLLPHPTTRTVLRALSVVLLGIGLAAATAGNRTARAERRAAGPLETLGLPGAMTVRAPLETVRALSALVATLDAQCDVYLVLPPQDRITFWTDLKGPQVLHVSAHGFSEEVQARVQARLKGSARPCWVRHGGWDVDDKSWTDYESTPLGRGASEWMQRGERFGEFVLFRR